MPAVSFEAVLFDLDGTLADTAPGLAASLNRLRARHGLPPLPLAEIRPQASHGARGLINLGFGLTPEDPRFATLRAEFLEDYARHLCDQTALFPGMDETLASLEARSLPWGVVTNKPERFTLPLLVVLGLKERAACVVCADSVGNAKPHPEPMLAAARQLAIPPDRCLYVGDAERDVLAARAAGMPALIALYGYLGSDDRPESWGAHGLVAHPLELLRFLG